MNTTENPSAVFFQILSSTWDNLSLHLQFGCNEPMDAGMESA